MAISQNYRADPPCQYAKGTITWRDDTAISHEFKGSSQKNSLDENSRINVQFHHPLQLCVLILGSPWSSWRFMAVPAHTPSALLGAVGRRWALLAIPWRSVALRDTPLAPGGSLARLHHKDFILKPDLKK